MHIYVRIEPRWGFADVRRACARVSPVRWNAGCSLVDITWWRKDRDPKSVFVDFNQKHPGPHHPLRLLCAGGPRGGRVGPADLGRDPRRRNPVDFTISHDARAVRGAGRPACVASDDAVFRLDELLEWADRDGQETPPEE